MNRFGVTVLVVAVAVTALAVVGFMQPVFGRAAEDKPATGGPHYTVVETEGHNLIVTDNATNTLYFYTVDKGEPVGSEVKLRASVDLTQVGKETIKPKAINIQK